MTQEDNELLLKDLCARLPYKVIGQYVLGEQKYGEPEELLNLDIQTEKVDCSNSMPYDVEYFKPYLRPMSSMTEEEKEEFEKISHCFLKRIVLKRDKKCRIVEQKAYFDNEIPSLGTFGDSDDYRYIKQEYFINLIDWLNAHHFDFRGLIDKGLAIEAPDDMYLNSNKYD